MAFLEGLGAAAPLMRSDLPEILWERRHAKPLIRCAENVCRGPTETAILSALSTALQETTLSLEPTRFQVTLNEFFTDYVPTFRACRSGLREDSGELSAALDHFAVSVSTHYDPNLERGLRCAIEVLDTVLLPYCDIRERLYSLSYVNQVEASGKARLLITLHHQHQHQQPASFMIDGKSRPAWRCGLPFGIRGLHWIRWQPQATQRAGTAPEWLEILVQAHALERLRERIPVEPWALQEWMWQSLNWPHAIDRGPSQWLVEFRLVQHRLGYLMAERIGSRLLIKTFLFLTMAGTPEGDELREKLRMSTPDLRWLEMDTLAYFAMSDLRNDPALRALFRDSGCEHLFSFLKADAGVHMREGLAQRTKKYLNLELPSI